MALRLSGASPVDVEGADLLVHSGQAAGERLGLLSVQGDLVTFGPGDPKSILRIRPGDAVEVDNSGFLAAQTYHRHQVPDNDEFPVWDQFRHPDGTPMYPQRPMILGPIFAAAAAGTVQTGRFEGKMIVVESLLDREALPWQADWYRARVRQHLGDALDDHFRVWFTDNALHGDFESQEDPTHTVSYVGMLHQALRDLSRWVEAAIPPPQSTGYEVVDGQVVVPPDAISRRGVQPVVSLTVDGAVRADVAPGEEVTLRVTAEVPPGTGSIVAAEWDFDGTGRYPVHDSLEPASTVVVERRWSSAEPGIFFPVVRVVSHRDGSATSPYAAPAEPGAGTGGRGLTAHARSRHHEHGRAAPGFRATDGRRRGAAGNVGRPRHRGETHATSVRVHTEGSDHLSRGPDAAWNHRTLESGSTPGSLREA